MGQFVSHTWFVYGRRVDNTWQEEPILSTVSHSADMDFHMARFRHLVYQLGLDQLDPDLCKLYLYQGWRVAKCERTDTLVRLTFATRAAADAWDGCKRSRLHTSFVSKYEIRPTGTLVLEYHTSAC